MANAGFSAATDYFGPIVGLTAKESSENGSSSVAEASNRFGDTIAVDKYDDRKHPSVTYAVTGEASTFPALGSIKTLDGMKIMVTNIAISTAAGQPPTVTISGEEVPNAVSQVRTYSVSATVKPRCKAQDVFGMFKDEYTETTTLVDFTSVNTTFSVEFISQTVAGEIVAACPSKGKVEVQATLTSADGTGLLTLASGRDGATLSASSKNAPDAGYVQITATATEALQGVEAN